MTHRYGLLAVIQRKANQGDASAEYQLGLMYEEGQDLPKDTTEAMKWYRKAAEQGDAWAQYWLGAAYDSGRGVPKDDAEAVKWWRKAAEQGDATAQNSLGFMYDHGRGVPEDYVLAHMWFNLAAAAAGNSAMARDLVAAKMTPAQIAEAQKLAREWKPTPDNK